METRRFFVAMGAAMAVFVAYQFIVGWLYPVPERPAGSPTTQTQPVSTSTQPGVSASQTPAPDTQAAPPSPTAAPQTPSGADSPFEGMKPQTAPAMGATTGLAFACEGEDRALMLGGRAGDALKATLTSRGGAVVALELTSREDGKLRYADTADKEQPYQILEAVEGAYRLHYSYETHRVWIREFDNAAVLLEDCAMEVLEATPERIVFASTLRQPSDDTDVLRLTKTYTLQKGKPLIDLELAVENLTDRALTVVIEQDGPIGVTKEHIQYDMRRILAAYYADGVVTLDSGSNRQRSDLKSGVDRGEPVRLHGVDQGPLAWTALANKYFAVFTRPLEEGEKTPEFVQSVHGVVAAARSEENRGDMQARLTTRPFVIEPTQSTKRRFEVYAGPKDSDSLKKLDPMYVGPTNLYYNLAQSADRRCCCTFLWLQEFMIWLLHLIFLGVRNYGVAIIILVIIIRTLLHPLTVFQQKSMYKMQEGMARLQPKMQAVKERYPNDRNKQNQEMMKVYAEEGVNPAASMISFIPLFIQMPILVALWTALNTDIELRHAVFDGWWIDDLSSPDALIPFSDPGLTVPILGQLPLIGKMFTNIPSFNLLPVLMGVSMWLQQKYMPKPGQEARLEAARKKAQDGAASGKSTGGMTPEDQLRQQQTIAYMMSIMFPLMFYYMPSGLNLYWMATNVFGIAESLIIRKQLKEEKERRERDGVDPVKKKKSGVLGGFFKRLAEQAEQLQKQADAMAQDEKRSREEKKAAKKETKKGRRQP